MKLSLFHHKQSRPAWARELKLSNRELCDAGVGRAPRGRVN